MKKWSLFAAAALMILCTACSAVGDAGEGTETPERMENGRIETYAQENEDTEMTKEILETEDAAEGSNILIAYFT